MTEKDINIEDEETLNEAPVEETDKETEETKAEEAAQEEEKDPLEAAKAEIEELKTQMLYKTAEFDNYRKRTLKEKAELILNGGEKAVSAVLPIIDDMERAIENGALERDEVIVESLNRLQIQVVGWCIQNQTVGIFQLHTGYHTTHLLTSAEHADLLLDVLVLEEHATQKRLHHHFVACAIL